MENQNVWVSTPVSANCNAAAFHLWQCVASRWVKTQKRKKCDFWSQTIFIYRHSFPNLVPHGQEWKIVHFLLSLNTNATVSAKQVVSWTEVSTGLCSTCRVEDVCDEHCNVARPIAWAKNSPQTNLIVQQMVFGNLDFRSARKPNYHIYINCFCSKCYTTNSGVSVSWTSSLKKFRH